MLCGKRCTLCTNTSANTWLTCLGVGALAAAAMGGCTLAASLRCGGTLLAFFFASSKLTRYAEERKDLDEAFKPGGQRDFKQVPDLYCCWWPATIPSCARMVACEI